MKMHTIILAMMMIAGCTNPDNPSDEPIVSTTEDYSAPKDLSVSLEGIRSAQLSWAKAPSWAAGARIERRFADADFSLVSELDASRCSYTDKSLSSNGKYTWRVCYFSTGTRSEWAEVSIDYALSLPKVETISLAMCDDGLRISWKDDIDGEEGFIVRKSTDAGLSFIDWKILSSGTESVVDTEVTPSINGVFHYDVRAYFADVRSESSVAVWESYGKPELRIDGNESSWLMASVNFTLASDGGEACETGICYGGSGVPSLDDPECSSIPCHRMLRSGESSFVNAFGLASGSSCSARLWARNNHGIIYSEPFTINRAAEPEAINATWTEIKDYNLPDGVGLYSTVCSISGRTVKAWYAVLDPSRSTARFVARKASSRTTVPAYVKSRSGDEKVLVMVNGGYFSGNDSYSLVCSDGKVLCQNIKALTRSLSYSVTRGAFGIENGVPSVRWTYPGSGGGVDSYRKPLPVVDGEPALSPGADFPAPRIAWNCTEAIGGAPVLLMNGELCFDYLKSPAGFYKTNYELLQGDIFADGLRAPRTAIGCTDDGKIILFAADGRGSGGSAGLTLDELARMMKGLGCSEALNLDGGGSTTICAGPQAAVLNSPSDSSPRAVLSYAGFIAE